MATGRHRTRVHRAWPSSRLSHSRCAAAGRSQGLSLTQVPSADLHGPADVDQAARRAQLVRRRDALACMRPNPDRAALGTGSDHDDRDETLPQGLRMTAMKFHHGPASTVDRAVRVGTAAARSEEAEERRTGRAGTCRFGQHATPMVTNLPPCSHSPTARPPHEAASRERPPTAPPATPPATATPHGSGRTHRPARPPPTRPPQRSPRSRGPGSAGQSPVRLGDSTDATSQATTAAARPHCPDRLPRRPIGTRANACSAAPDS